MQAVARSLASAPAAATSLSYRRFATAPSRYAQAQDHPPPRPLSESAVMTRNEAPIPSGPYPLNGLLPKEEIQAAAFIKRFPTYDGRNVRVAVLDTGVDPAAFGLNGKGKVVDIIDCTGGGDIPLKEVEPIKDDALLTQSKLKDAILLPGLSGRALAVSSKWSNPTGKWKVGYKPAFQLFPKDLVRRRKGERKHDWDVKVGDLIAKAKSDLNAFENKAKEVESKKPSQSPAKNDNTVTKGKNTKSTEEPKKDRAEEKAKKADLEARLEYLKSLEINDPGPIIETVVWHDGKDWRMVAGGAEGDGEENISPTSDKTPTILNLQEKRPMTDFSREQHYERFGTLDLLSYSVNFYDDGNLLSIACVSGTHGTHVAAIIGGHVQGSPELSGVAPGVEIVSLQIGDNRVDALETHQALMRATKAIIDTKCDICNMSFGEDAAWSLEDRGQFITMLRDEVIRKRNVIFVAAAGNSGPALSTVGAPATTSGIVAVGAYETPSMQVSDYALLDNVPAGAYTWSSRGPMYDGANITCFAPGGAVTGVPVYNLQRSQLMNGTSMASPSACGALSLVISAMKAENIPVTPARIHKAIAATSKDVKDPQNIGLIQVEALYQHIVETKDIPDCDAYFDVSIVSQGHPAPDFSKPLHDREGVRGVYLREPAETSKIYEAAVWVKPTFAVQQDTEKMYKLDMKLALVATEPWVRTPEYLSLPYNGRNFNVRVDPTRLPPGLHCAEIKAYDTENHGRMIFSVPITVCKPQVPTEPSDAYKQWHSTPGLIERSFLSVPEGATWAELRVTTKNHSSPVNMWIHCVQLYPLRRLSQTEMQAILACTAGETVSKTFPVTGGRTLELCASQFWSSLPSADINLEIHFHGLTLLQGSQLSIVGASDPLKLQVESRVRLENYEPTLALDRLRTLIRPSESRITPLGNRDLMVDGERLYQLVNTYSIKISEKTKVKPVFPISDNLYDSAFATLTAIFDSRKQIIQLASVYPHEVELKKGDYTMLLHMEHSNYKVLSGHKNMALTLETPLSEKSKTLKLDLERDHIGLLSSSKGQAVKNAKMPRGETRSLVIGSELSGDTADLYKSGKAGDVLLGKLVLHSSHKMAPITVKYVLPPQAKDSDKEDSDKDKDKPLLVDLKLSIAEKIEDEAEKEAFLTQLAAEHPKHLPLLVARLKAVKDDAEPLQIIKAADAIFAEINENELAAYLGRKQPPKDEQTDEEKKAKKEMDIRKSAWTLANTRKLQASVKSSAPKEEQDELFRKCRTFMDSPEKDPDFGIIAAKRDIAAGRYGTALTALQKLLDEDSSSKKYTEIVDLKDQCVKGLSWTSLTEYESRWRLFRVPPSEFVW